jgi:hypothetical protein
MTNNVSSTPSSTKTPAASKSKTVKKFTITAAVQFLTSNTICSKEVLASAQGGMTAAINKLTTGAYNVSAYCYNETVKYTARRLQGSTTTVLDPTYLTIFFTITDVVEADARVAVDTVTMLISNRTILQDAIEALDAQQAYGPSVVIVGGSEPLLTSSDSEAGESTGTDANA